ncbi:MAG: hypothetical protein QFF03_16145 [Pseudomonadota bacterium]|nr:hypothetical protein [Pseudomonadota bacterium]
MIAKLIENLIVAVIVLFAALYVARKYLPKSWRTRLVYLLAARGASQAALARWLNTESSCGSGCDTCKACAEPAPKPTAAAAERVIKIHVRR